MCLLCYVQICKVEVSSVAAGIEKLLCSIIIVCFVVVFVFVFVSTLFQLFPVQM